jgi:hypothetical protein
MVRERITHDHHCADRVLVQGPEGASDRYSDAVLISELGTGRRRPPTAYEVHGARTNRDGRITCLVAGIGYISGVLLQPGRCGSRGNEGQRFLHLGPALGNALFVGDYGGASSPCQLHPSVAKAV